MNLLASTMTWVFHVLFWSSCVKTQFHNVTRTGLPDGRPGGPKQGAVRWLGSAAGGIIRCYSAHYAVIIKKFRRDARINWVHRAWGGRLPWCRVHLLAHARSGLSIVDCAASCQRTARPRRAAKSRNERSYFSSGCKRPAYTIPSIVEYAIYWPIVNVCSYAQLST